MSDARFFTCDVCGHKFEMDNTEEESKQEFEDAFGEKVDDVGGMDALASLCDDCYADFMKWFRAMKVN